MRARADSRGQNAESGTSTGIYRGRSRVRRRTWQAGRSSAAASFLGFLWPGLGHAYAGRSVVAVLLALPPVVLLFVAAITILQSPEAFALRLLAPAFAIPVIGLVALHAIWRIAAIMDAWRRTRSRPWRRDGSLFLAVVLSAIVVISHVWVGAYVQSVSEAGERIFSSGEGGLDDILHGTPSAEGDADDDLEPHERDPEGLDDWDDWDSWGSDDPGPGTPSDDPRPSGLPASGPISVLIIGTDSRPSRSHSLTDTLIVATYFPERNQVTMISVPRDTGRLLMYDGRTFGPRINTMLGRANRDPVRFPDGGMGTLVRQMEFIVGVPIHYWAITNIHGFRDLVDVVGGVEVRLDKPIADRSKDLFLDAGTYFFDGAEVMRVVRSRRGPGNSDWERARRQQHVLRAVTRRLTDPAIALRMPEVLNAASGLIRTNCPPSQVADLFVLLDRSEHATSRHFVLNPRRYASRIPPQEVNGRYMTQLNMSAVAELSRELFGEYSRYSR